MCGSVLQVAAQRPVRGGQHCFGISGALIASFDIITVMVHDVPVLPTSWRLARMSAGLETQAGEDVHGNADCLTTFELGMINSSNARTKLWLCLIMTTVATFTVCHAIAGRSN